MESPIGKSGRARGYRLDACGTDGKDLSKVMVVLPGGSRVPLSEFDAAEFTARYEALVGATERVAGERIGSVTVDQLKLLVWLLLWKAGALDGDMRVRPVKDWL